MVHEWQQRVIDELSDLEAKLEKLNAFLLTPRGGGGRHRVLMLRQYEEMAAYAKTLRERIALFADLV